jgi:hypothetical protein
MAPLYCSAGLDKAFDSYHRLQKLGEALAESESRPTNYYVVEIHDLALFLICCVFAKNQDLEAAESAFLNAWLGEESSVEENARALTERLARWKRAVPNFVGAAILHDQQHQEALTEQILENLNDLVLATAAATGDSPLHQCGEGISYYFFLRNHVISQGILLGGTRTARGGAARRGARKSRNTRSGVQPMESLETLLQQLQALVGLARVKTEVQTLANLIRIRTLRAQHGLTAPAMSHHLVFSGNPGTGKTTVARLLARIYQSLGVLEKGHLVETDRGGLVAGYVGQTALKVKEVVEKSIGGVLFVDEAYALVAGKDQEDYGREAVDTLVKLMEDRRDEFIVIVAGYIEPMQEFLNSNPGLRSRFNKFIHFDDFTPQELYDIFVKFCAEAGYDFDEEGGRILAAECKEMYRQRGPDFANARTMRNYFEETISRHANRVAQLAEPSAEDLETLTAADFHSAGWGVQLLL